MKLMSGGFCEPGSRAGENQDSIGIYERGNSGLYFVADGMGGHSDGARASRVLADACADWWNSYLESGAQTDFDRATLELKAALSGANSKIWNDTDRMDICGSTIVLLWIQSDRYALIWSGDSRCYRTQKIFFGLRVNQITRDDVWENQPEVRKSHTGDETKSHPDCGKLVRAVGVKENFVCTVQTDSLREKSVFALCSDGVYKYGSRGMLERQMKAAVRTDNIEKPLVAVRKDVYRNSAPDNLSCIFIKACPE